MFLDTVWDKTIQSLQEQAKGEEELAGESHREQTIIIDQIIRIMCHIFAKMPFKDMPKETVEKVVQMGHKQVV